MTSSAHAILPHLCSGTLNLIWVSIYILQSQVTVTLSNRCVAMAAQPESRQGFEVAIICALPIEGTAIDALFETEWDGYGKQIGDPNAYTTG
ncbi:unnamed protein product [Clonostachys rhizophaga]|uniref:Uncharacterized protein n=1 Tax=Clonostachys rhizophaga TaxID=160324 RepID=A0A9N9YSL8_9HYPO|nr:unnamed protein product [Clonostachys rhizophaga]